MLEKNGELNNPQRRKDNTENRPINQRDAVEMAAVNKNLKLNGPQK